MSTLASDGIVTDPTALEHGDFPDYLDAKSERLQLSGLPRQASCVGRDHLHVAEVECTNTALDLAEVTNHQPRRALPENLLCRCRHLRGTDSSHTITVCGEVVGTEAVDHSLLAGR